MQALLTPDAELLRRFGYVRAVGLVAYLVAVGVLLLIFGTEVWPLLIGVPVLTAVTIAYFLRPASAPRTSVGISLVADLVVLGAGPAFVGGTSSGIMMIYTIVIVSAGILLGPGGAWSFTTLAIGASFAQLAVEELGVTPSLLYRPDLDERVPVLLISVAVLAAVGYLTATYGSRLHELVAQGRQEAAAVQLRGRRRRHFVEQAGLDVREPLRELEEVARVLADEPGDISADERVHLARRLRAITVRAEAEVGLLSDLGTLDAVGDGKLEPVNLRRATDDVLVALADRLAPYRVEVDLPEVRVAADGRGVRRIVYSLLENVADHTPEGTRVKITTLTTAGRGVLAVSDDGPGIPVDETASLFDAPDERTKESRRLGLPLVAELCQAMDGEVRYEPTRWGGARFLVAFRLAPRDAPTREP